jgi:hypothetical protein
MTYRNIANVEPPLAAGARLRAGSNTQAGGRQSGQTRRLP